jgi:hypothetical protein
MSFLLKKFVKFCKDVDNRDKLLRTICYVSRIIFIYWENKYGLGYEKIKRLQNFVKALSDAR